MTNVKQIYLTLNTVFFCMCIKEKYKFSNNILPIKINSVALQTFNKFDLVGYNIIFFSSFK